MYIVKFVTRKEPETNFPPYCFGNILKFGLSYKAGIGLFWVVIHKDGTKTYINHKFYTIGILYYRANKRFRRGKQ